ncbi:MAG: hypothetical protein H0V66_13305 [Bdellovibrionales bacterium]|nr:hypothetical protein [Bdellovibrionales bacterium]
MKILSILMVLFSLTAFGQQELQIEGSLGKNVETKKDIRFTLKWKEKDGRASGTYSDNYYTKEVEVKGLSGPQGRIFVVTFPQEIKGARTISFLGPAEKLEKESKKIPVSVVVRDNRGKPINTSAIDATLKPAPPPAPDTRVAQRQEEEQGCQEGFGALAGYCGRYAGMLGEEVDSNGKCDLLSITPTHLVLDQNGELGLVLGETSDILNPPIHRIGRIFTNTDSPRVDVISRSCQPLPGTSLRGEDCKRLNLDGTFTLRNNIKHFSGSYTITNEKTNENCRYSLSMDIAM